LAEQLNENVVPVNKPLSKLVLASYAAPATPLALVGLPMAVYLPAIYADSDGFGLALGMVGLILTLSRFTDVITDPIIGFLSDRLKSPWGRRKPFILVGTPIYAAGIWLLFVPPITFSQVTWMGFEFNSGYPYLFCMVALTYLGSTIKDLPYLAWGAELSRNYNERTLVTSWREGFAVAGSLISAFTPALILFAGYTKPTDAVYFLSVAMCIVMPIVVLNALMVVPEYPVVIAKEKIPLKDSLKLVMANEPYVMLVIIFVFSTVGSAMTNSLSFFFVKHLLLAGDLYGLYLAPYFVSQIVAIPLWFALSRRIGKHRATMVAIGWYALWSCFIPLVAIAPASWFTAFGIPEMLAFLPDQQHQAVVDRFDGMDTGKFLFFVLIMCLKGSAIGALAALPAAMAADVVDVDTATTGEQRAGAYFSIWSMTRKASYAIGITVGTGAAVFFGFDSLADPMNTTNTPDSLLMLACLYSVIPALFKFVAMPLLWKYPLTEERLEEIQLEIRQAQSDSSNSNGTVSAP